MDFDTIFQQYYTIYRAESNIPSSTDDEYIIALRLANEAVNRWENYDNTYWKELFTTLQTSGNGDTVSLGVTDYDCPDDFKEAGGFVRILDPTTGTTQRNYPIIEPQEVQFKIDNAQYAYFTGNPAEGYTLHLNPAPDTAIAGSNIDYVYYKKATEFSSGTDVTEMSNPYFVVQRMLYQRYRASRNPFYSSALRDGEDILKMMQMDNLSGNWADPWKVTDTSGVQWGR